MSSIESRLTITVIGVLFIFRNTDTTVLAGKAFTWRLRRKQTSQLKTFILYPKKLKSGNCQVWIKMSYPCSVMMEGCICMKLFSFSVFVCGQQLTQTNTLGVGIRSHVERITIWFTNTKKSAVQLIFHHGRWKFLCPQVIEGIALKVTERNSACRISVQSAVLHGTHQLQQWRKKRQERQEQHGDGRWTVNFWISCFRIPKSLNVNGKYGNCLFIQIHSKSRCNLRVKIWNVTIVN